MNASHIHPNVKKALRKVEQRIVQRQKVLVERWQSKLNSKTPLLWDPKDCRTDCKKACEPATMQAFVDKEVEFAKDLWQTLVPLEVKVDLNEKAVEKWLMLSPFKIQVKAKEQDDEEGSDGEDSFESEPDIDDGYVSEDDADA